MVPDLARQQGFVIGSNLILGYEGFMDSNPMPEDKPKPTQKQAMSLFLRAFLVPTFVTKALIVFFGLRWVEYPDDGYGYGLVISVILMLVNFGLFIRQCSKYHFD